MRIDDLEKKYGIVIPDDAKEDLHKAIKFYRKFHWGDEFEAIRKIQLDIPKAMFAMGHIIGLIYLAQKKGKEDVYIHVFKPPFPLLLGGKNQRDIILVIGGNFRVEEEGIIG
ncbi:MAG: hypothetical protein QXJ14_02800 [Candidatus Aenigmatarchaeota archaeon]